MVAGGHDPAQVASDNGVEARHTYRAALNGFAGAASPQQLDKLRKDERVLAVEQDRLHRLLDAPTGVNRAEADKNTNATDDGSDNIDVDVAVIDTGIAAHDDLDLRGGRNFAGGPSSKWPDKNGHGTHVAGSEGGIGGTGKVMGVAPGANLWALRACNGLCASSDIAAAMNEVVACKKEFHNNGTETCNLDANGIDFAVATMSIGTNDDKNVCTGSSGAVHEAVCRMVEVGVVFTLAAGNENREKKAYPEAITVSALADFDGMGGGAGSPTCRTDDDDTLASFSNYGPEVDIAAPGTCILSTWKDGGYNTISGTSMATPHVAGAVALYLHANGLPPATDGAGVDSIAAAIINAALPQGTSNDVCSYNDSRVGGPLLYVNGTAFNGDGTGCDVAAATAGITVSPTTGLVTTEDLSTDTFTVVLDTLPSADVTIDLSASDTSEGTVLPVSLNFTTANWDTTQTVTVTGLDDTEVDGNRPYTILTAAAASADEDYNGMDPEDVSVTNTDNDGTAAVYNVSSMILDVKKKGRWHNLTATMTIKDAAGALAPDGITVTGKIFRDGRTFDYSQTTDASGVVQFKLKTQMVGETYTAEVTGAGSSFDPLTGCPSLSIVIAAGAEEICPSPSPS